MLCFEQMFHVNPSLQWELPRNIPNEVAMAQGAIVTSALRTRPLLNVTPALEEETAINAYFGHIRGIVPLIDEASFREVWRRGQRCDRPWLALLNMLLVLGSLAIADRESGANLLLARATIPGLRNPRHRLHREPAGAPSVGWAVFTLQELAQHGVRHHGLLAYRIAISFNRVSRSQLAVLRRAPFR